MNVEIFINKLKSIADSVETIYAMGTYGQPITEELITKNAKRLEWYTPTRINTLKKNINKIGFDCSGLIKAVACWGYPNTKYNANTDVNADTMIKLCSNISTDFTNIEKGEMVYMKGHAGVYIGDGLVIECTPKWSNGVQYTKLSTRKWLKHGRLPWVEYSTIYKPQITKAFVNTVSSNLNVRTGAGVRYDVIGQFAKGSRIEILNADNKTWLYCKGIDTKGRVITGYCFSKYIKGVN